MILNLIGPNFIKFISNWRLLIFLENNGSPAQISMGETYNWKSGYIGKYVPIKMIK